MHHFCLFSFSYLFFSWRIIALQNCLGFCQTPPWISHQYTYVPSLLNSLPPPSPPHPAKSFLTSDSISLTDIRLFWLSVSSPVSFGGLYLSRNLSREFPGFLVVRIQPFTAAARVQSLVGGVRSLEAVQQDQKERKRNLSISSKCSNLLA